MSGRPSERLVKRYVILFSSHMQHWLSRAENGVIVSFGYDVRPSCRAVSCDCSFSQVYYIHRFVHYFGPVVDLIYNGGNRRQSLKWQESGVCVCSLSVKVKVD